MHFPDTAAALFEIHNVLKHMFVFQSLCDFHKLTPKPEQPELRDAFIV